MFSLGEYFRALAHQRRIDIVKLLARGPRFKQQIKADLNTSGDRLKRHLEHLCRQGIIERDDEYMDARYTLIDTEILKMVKLGERIFYEC